MSDEIAPDLWDFLINGEAPYPLTLPGWKPIPPDQAMKVIYVLQEAFGLLSDVWEHCAGCNILFDSSQEYYIDVGDEFYCSSCAPNVGTGCFYCSQGVSWEEAVQAEDEEYYHPKCWEEATE